MRISNRFLTPVLLAAALVLSAAPPAFAKIFDPDTFMLDNGMQVVLITNHRAPVVRHMVWYKVGAADEAPGETGIAHLLGRDRDLDLNIKAAIGFVFRG